MNIGLQIKLIRKKYKLSQTNLGDILNISNQMISKIETNKVNPSKKIIDKIYNEFKIHIKLNDDVIQTPKTYTKDQLKEYEKEIVETYELIRDEKNKFSKIASINRTIIDLNIHLEEKMLVLESLCSDINEDILIKILNPLKTTRKNLEKNLKKINLFINDQTITIKGDD